MTCAGCSHPEGDHVPGGCGAAEKDLRGSDLDAALGRGIVGTVVFHLGEPREGVVMECPCEGFVRKE